ncbi:MAG: acyltransferase family protein [Clostridia bacterium]|nr:acyltransferase family protein [Clostridia bacterium]
MYIFYLLVLLVPLLALKPRKDGDGNILDAKSTTCIKGLLCLYVMLHNLGLDVADTPIKARICEYTGGIGVGIFFFLSAFGIIRSYQKHGNKFLPKLLFVHIPKLWLVAVFINALTYFSFFQGSYETADTWLRILNLDFFNGFKHINRHGWYIASIIALYCIFAVVYYLCSKLKTERKFIIAGLILAIVPIAFRTVAKVADTGVMYTRELPTFAIGCLYATFYDKINELASKYFKLGIIVTIVGFCIGFILVEDVATYAATLFVIFISQRYTYYNKTTFFLGKICIGVYLFLHYSSIVMQPFIYNEYLWVVTNAIFILAVATLIYTVQYGIESFIRTICSRRQEKISP